MRTPTPHAAVRGSPQGSPAQPVSSTGCRTAPPGRPGRAAAAAAAADPASASGKSPQLTQSLLHLGSSKPFTVCKTPAQSPHATPYDHNTCGACGQCTVSKRPHLVQSWSRQRQLVDVANVWKRQCAARHAILLRCDRCFMAPVQPAAMIRVSGCCHLGLLR